MPASKKSAAEASLSIVAVGQTSVSTPSAPSKAGGAIPEEVAPMEGSALHGANAGSSRDLVHAGGDLHTWEGPVLRWADR
jgi:hypothetical protein